MATPWQQLQIVKIALVNDQEVLVEFSTGVSALIPTELLGKWILQVKDSIAWSDRED